MLVSLVSAGWCRAVAAKAAKGSSRASASAAAARLRAHFGWAAPAPAGTGPALSLLSGLPGTGKSYLASAIQPRRPAAIVRSDEVRKTLFPEPKYTVGENGFVYLTSYALLSQLLADGY